MIHRDDSRSGPSLIGVLISLLSIDRSNFISNSSDSPSIRRRNPLRKRKGDFHDRPESLQPFFNRGFEFRAAPLPLAEVLELFGIYRIPKDGEGGSLFGSQPRSLSSSERRDSA